jgi:hypothetical protein
MSGAGGFFQRVVTQVADKLVTQQLAKSKGFQKFAQDTHRTVQHAKKSVKEAGTPSETGFFAEIRAAKAQASKELEAAKAQLKREIQEELKK